MRGIILIWTLFFRLTSCQSQDNNNRKKIGVPCEGCEAIYEYGTKVLTNTDTLPSFNTTNPKLKISGLVYQKDGKTPAKDVIVYIYHTNRQGIYPTMGDEVGWGQRHGYIRGWIKTNSNGEYTFYTFRPGAYPTRKDPEHIHITIKEPNKNEYYIDEFLFDDDPLLVKMKRESLRNRGGSGIVLPKPNGSINEVTRNIILGLNIPDYY